MAMLVCVSPAAADRAQDPNEPGSAVPKVSSPRPASIDAPADVVYPWPVWTPAPVKVAPSRNGRTYYVDARLGSDLSEGDTQEHPFSSIAKAVSVVHAGDSVLIHAGLYHEGITLFSAPNGAPDKVTTFGAFGDGEVILDGSQAVSGWRALGGGVWKAPIRFNPIAIIVNERPLRQVPQGQGRSTAPQVGIAGV